MALNSLALVDSNSGARNGEELLFSSALGSETVGALAIVVPSALRETCWIPWVIFGNPLLEGGSVSDPSYTAVEMLVERDCLLFVEPPSSASLSEKTSSLFRVSRFAFEGSEVLASAEGGTALVAVKARSVSLLGVG